MGMVGLEKVEAGSEEEHDVKAIIEEHVKRTGSARGQVRESGNHRAVADTHVCLHVGFPRATVV